LEQTGDNCKAIHLQKLAQLFGVTMEELLCEYTPVPVVFLEPKSIESLSALHDVILRHKETFPDAEKHLNKIAEAIRNKGRCHSQQECRC
jgi:hypothetical protein